MDTDRAQEALAEFAANFPALQSPSAETVEDGRVANRLRNRDKVIDALIASLRAGESGTIDEIIARSGVARRSIFRYFDDLSDLLLAGFQRVMMESVPRSVLPDLGLGSVTHRVEAYVSSRLRALEVTYSVRKAARARLADREAVHAGLAVVAQISRGQISRQFARELADLPDEQAQRLTDEIFVTTSFDAYDVLIDQLGRSVDDIRATWIDAVGKLIATA